jgi:hypothetical protein
MSASNIAWSDFSDEDQKRAQDYLRSLSEGTLDELGFGIIIDRFADLFFPSTSTIMTRGAKYQDIPELMFQCTTRDVFGRASGVNVTPPPYPTHTISMSNSNPLRSASGDAR